MVTARTTQENDWYQAAINQTVNGRVVWTIFTNAAAAASMIENNKFNLEFRISAHFTPEHGDNIPPWSDLQWAKQLYLGWWFTLQS